VVSHRNVAFELHLIAKTANQLRRAAWAEAHGKTEEYLREAEVLYFQRILRYAWTIT